MCGVDIDWLSGACLIENLTRSRASYTDKISFPLFLDVSLLHKTFGVVNQAIEKLAAIPADLNGPLVLED